MGSGYTDCACRDCFDVTVSDDMDHPDLCNACADAGCDPDDSPLCERSDAYGADDLCEHGNWLCSHVGCENNHREDDNG
jgi:hypothetical protein